MGFGPLTMPSLLTVTFSKFPTTNQLHVEIKIKDSGNKNGEVAKLQYSAFLDPPITRDSLQKKDELQAKNSMISDTIKCRK